MFTEWTHLSPQARAGPSPLSRPSRVPGPDSVPRSQGPELRKGTALPWPQHARRPPPRLALSSWTLTTEWACGNLWPLQRHGDPALALVRGWGLGTTDTAGSQPRPRGWCRTPGPPAGVPWALKSGASRTDFCGEIPDCPQRAALSDVSTTAGSQIKTFRVLERFHRGTEAAAPRAGLAACMWPVIPRVAL